MAVVNRWPRVTALAVAGFAIIGAVAFLALNAMFGSIDWIDSITLTVAFAAFGLVGSVIIAGRPGHRIGWVFVAIFTVGLASGILGVLSDATNAPMAVILSNLSWWPTLFIAFVLLPLWFPTGAPPSRRWSWVVWLGAITLVGVSMLDLVQEQVCVDVVEDTTEPTSQVEGADGPVGGDCLEWAANPIGIPGVKGAEEGGVGDIFFLGILVTMVAALSSVVVRYRRSMIAERLQLKWFLFSIVMLIGWTLVGDVLFIDLLRADDVLFGDAISSLIFGIALIGMPVSAGIAITRYRLYEIDRIINRTVVYAIVAGVLALLFVAGTVGVPSLLPAGANDVAVAGTTLAAFFLFRPIRTGVQRIVDRRFYRSRYDAQRIADGFSARLRDRVAAEELTAEWADVVAGTIQPVTIGVWVREV
ncbi:MAG: hypothetical protein R3246_09660 [Acidimicrobiia bacterium]|nr:hypothetical protein [Acidimicrobiia bacterium]